MKLLLDKSLAHEQRIALLLLLLLLTFIENAFKHGVSQEVGRAEIEISLRTEENGIRFHISNTVPRGAVTDAPDREEVGRRLG